MSQEVADLVHDIERFCPDRMGEQKQILATTSKEAARVLSLMYQRGMDVAIHTGITQDDYDGIQAPRSVLHALSLLRKGFTRTQLKEAFVNDLGWAPNSAWTGVSLTWAVLIAVKAAVEIDGRLQINPEVVG